jgi:hypothetical protein
LFARLLKNEPKDVAVAVLLESVVVGDGDGLEIRSWPRVEVLSCEDGSEHVPKGICETYSQDVKIFHEARFVTSEEA